MPDVFRPMVNGKRSRYWYGKVLDPGKGKWVKVALHVTDKQVARKLLREKQQRAEQVAHGLISPLDDAPLAEHLAAYLLDLRQQDCDPVYIGQTESAVIKAALYCAGRPVPSRLDWKKMDAHRQALRTLPLGVFTVDKVDAFLAGLPASVSARTRNSYRASVLGLFNFLVDKGKLAFNPLSRVTRHRGKLKRKRRALPADKLQALFDAARARPLERASLISSGARKGQVGARLKPETRARLERLGRERALIYLTAFYTGLRRRELRSLLVKHLNLAGELPHVRLPGELTKNGDEAALPLPGHLAALLAEWTAGRGPDEPVLRVPKRTNGMVAGLKQDLAFAGIPYVDEQGRVFDFHSLRKSLGTHLRLAKVDPSVSQQFMRHGDIRLTMEVYNDDQLHDLRAEVVDKLPVLTV
jgi:integrase